MPVRTVHLILSEYNGVAACLVQLSEDSANCLRLMLDDGDILVFFRVLKVRFSVCLAANRHGKQATHLIDTRFLGSGVCHQDGNGNTDEKKTAKEHFPRKAVLTEEANQTERVERGLHYGNAENNPRHVNRQYEDYQQCDFQSANQILLLLSHGHLPPHRPP